MKRLLVVMNHQLLPEQREDFGGPVITLQEIHPDLHAVLADLSWAEVDYISALAHQILATAKISFCSHIAVMGEPTLVAHIVMNCAAYKIQAITSVSKRISEDIPQADGSVKKISVFKHERWRNMI